MNDLQRKYSEWVARQAAKSSWREEALAAILLLMFMIAAPLLLLSLGV